VRAIHDSIQLIAQNPYASERTNDADIRVKVIQRYSYKIFYRIIDADTIRIIHIRHTSRRPWPMER
jgi:plasmid stabilization system protein ParE